MNRLIDTVAWVLCGVAILIHSGASQGFAQDDQAALQTAARGAGKAAEQSIHVTGTVVDEAGRPVAGIEVQRVDWSKYTGYRPTATGETTRSDADGNFQFEIRNPPPARIYDLWFVVRDPADQRQGLVTCSPDALEKNAPLQITLRPMQTVRVRVVNEKSAPVADAFVEMTDRAVTSVLLGKSAGAVLSQKSDVDGKATLRVPADAWHNPIVAFKSKVGLDYFYIPESAKRRQHEPWPEEITLKLSGARSVRLKAVDEAKQPLPSVKFGVTDVVLPGKVLRVGDYQEPYGVDLTGCGGAQATTDAAGIAVFDWLPPEFDDRICFQLMSPEYNPWHQVGFSPRQPQLFRKSLVEELTVTLVRRTEILGKVMFADGRPAPNMVVQATGVSREGESAHGVARTKVDGSYEMSVESERSYIVCVVDDTWAGPAHECLLAQGKPIENIDFTLAKATTIKGRITDGPDHRPLVAQRVSLRMESNHFHDEWQRDSAGYMFPKFYRDTLTDESGSYQFRVGPGLYTIGLWGLPFSDLAIDAKSPPEIIHDISLPTRAAKIIKGTVVDPDGRPAANVSIDGNYSPRHLEFHGHATTAADGTFELQREPLSLVLNARSADHHLAGAAMVRDQEDKVTLRLRPVAEAHGRLIDHHGNPITVGTIQYDSRFTVGTDRATVQLDSQGRFTLFGLSPGNDCQMRYCKSVYDWFGLPTIHPDKPETIELGDVVGQKSPAVR